MFKGMCYIFLILGFLLFFNKDPLFCVVIVAVAVGLYAFFKLRKRGKGTSSGVLSGFLSSRSLLPSRQNEDISQLMKFMVVQQMLSASQQPSPTPTLTTEEKKVPDPNEEDELEKEKQAILKLLED